MAISKPKYDDSVIEEARKWIRKHSASFAKTRKDFIKSHNMYAGKWYDRMLQDMMGNDRLIRSVNLMRPVINSIVQAYKSNPIGIALTGGDDDAERQKKDMLQAEIIKIMASTRSQDIFSNSIFYTAVGGTSYWVVYNTKENNKDVIDIKELNSINVFFDPNAKHKTGKDAERVVVYDYIGKDKAERLYDISERELDGYTSPFADNELKDCIRDDMALVVTYYRRKKDGWQISKIVGDRVVEQTLLPIKRCPVIREVGELVMIDGKIYYQGMMKFVEGLLTQVNINQTTISERLARASQVDLISSARAAKGFEQIYAERHKKPMGYLPFNDLDEGGNPIAPPTPIDLTAKTQDMQTTQDSAINLIYTIVGTGKPGSEVQSNTTAEAVLLRRKNSETPNAIYIENAAESHIQTGYVIIDFISMIIGVEINTYDIIVESGPLHASSRRQSLAELVSLAQYLQQVAPEAVKQLIPQMILSTELPNANQLSKEIAGVLGINVEQNNPQQAMQSMQQQLQAIQQQLAEKDGMLSQLQQQVIQAQNYINANESKIRADILMNQQDNDTKIQTALIQANASKDVANQNNATKVQTTEAKLAADLEKSFQQAPELTMVTIPDTDMM